MTRRASSGGKRSMHRIPSTHTRMGEPIIREGSTKVLQLCMYLEPKHLPERERQKLRADYGSQFAAMAGFGQRRCHRCGGDVYGQTQRCMACGKLAVTLEERRQARWLYGDGAGRPPAWYTALRRLGQGYGKAIEAKAKEAKAHGAKPKRPVGYWIDRLRAERPDLWDDALGRGALLYRARYHLDPEYREHEINRTRAKELDRARRADGTLTPRVIGRMFASARQCPYCDKPMQREDKQLDHIMPIALGGLHGVSNAIVCCKACNMAKRDRHPDDWFAEIGRQVIVPSNDEPPRVCEDGPPRRAAQPDAAPPPLPMHDWWPRRRKIEAALERFATGTVSFVAACREANIVSKWALQDIAQSPEWSARYEDAVRARSAALVGQVA